MYIYIFIIYIYIYIYIYTRTRTHIRASAFSTDSAIQRFKVNTETNFIPVYGSWSSIAGGS